MANFMINLGEDTEDLTIVQTGKAADRDTIFTSLAGAKERTKELLDEDIAEAKAARKRIHGIKLKEIGWDPDEEMDGEESTEDTTVAEAYAEVEAQKEKKEHLGAENPNPYALKD